MLPTSFQHLLKIVVKYTNHKRLPCLPFLRVQFNGIKYVQNVVQLSPPSISTTFSSSQTETMYPLSNNSPFPSLQSLVTSILLPVSMNLPILGTTYKWNHIVIFVTGLFYFNIMFSRFTQVVACVISFILIESHFRARKELLSSCIQ